MSEENSLPIGSAGGTARAAKLTPEHRKEIARKAAAAKWNIPVASHDGNLAIAGWKNFPCWVLNDERRIISQRSFMAAIGMAGSSRVPVSERVSQILDPRNTRSNSAAALVHQLEHPIRFYTKDQIEAFGYDGEIIVEFCQAVLYARRVGNLAGAALDYADQAERLLVALGKTGIAGLIDEATGYQEVRAKDALAKILEQYIAKELQPWTSTFPEDFYKEIFRLRKWQWGDTKKITRRPAVVGHWTNDFVYDRLAPGVRQELCVKNPKLPTGRRKNLHYKWLTGDIGHPALKAHLDVVVRFLSKAKNWGEFRNLLDRFYPKLATTELGFDVPVCKKPLPEN
jgi:hypothetical protein